MIDLRDRGRIYRYGLAMLGTTIGVSIIFILVHLAFINYTA
jgi:hypothetical protein